MREHRGKTEGVNLPVLPDKHVLRDIGGYVRANQFTRNNMKGILHLITRELKSRGSKVPHIFLPFRSRIDDRKLEEFLRSIFPDGQIIPTTPEEPVKRLLEEFDAFTLICGLKYIWSRFPNNEIIGWDVYLEFKRREKEAGYPKNAFLSIMPKCLSSLAHASIVYDFLDLLVSVSSNSQYNYLNGRKITKMASLWAFNYRVKPGASPFFDATLNEENTFVDGMESWKHCADAMFHLLISFLRAMLPENDMDTLKLPKTLQSLLISTSYPPVKNTDSLKSVITIPCVVIRSTKWSSDTYELLSKIRHTISFDKKDAFLSMENYTILKNIFKKPSTSDIVSMFTEESKRIFDRLNQEPIDSKFGLYPGWAKPEHESDPNIPLYSQLSISNIAIQDYYIWAWLSSLASDQSTQGKKLFGRSIVIEVNLKGFQKWIVVSEQLIDSEEYLRIFKRNVSGASRKISLSLPANNSGKNSPLPPPPPPIPSKNNSIYDGGDQNSGDFLPRFDFDDDDFQASIEKEVKINGHVYPLNLEDELFTHNRSSKETQGESLRKKGSLRKPPSSPLDEGPFIPKTRKHAEPRPREHEKSLPPPPFQSYDPAPYHNNIQRSEAAPIAPHAPLPLQQDSANSGKQTGSHIPERTLRESQEVYIAEHPHTGSRVPERIIRETQEKYIKEPVVQIYADDTVGAKNGKGFVEPFDYYETDYDRLAKEKLKVSNEPFDNYVIRDAPQEKHDKPTNHIPHPERAAHEANYDQNIQIASYGNANAYDYARGSDHERPTDGYFAANAPYSHAVPFHYVEETTHKGGSYDDTYASAMRPHEYLPHEAPGVPAKVTDKSVLEEPLKPVGYDNNDNIDTSVAYGSTMPPHGYLPQEVPEARAETSTYVPDEVPNPVGYADDNVNTSAINHEQLYGINYDPAAAIAEAEANQSRSSLTYEPSSPGLRKSPKHKKKTKGEKKHKKIDTEVEPVAAPDQPPLPPPGAPPPEIISQFLKDNPSLGQVLPPELLNLFPADAAKQEKSKKKKKHRRRTKEASPDRSRGTSPDKSVYESPERYSQSSPVMDPDPVTVPPEPSNHPRNGVPHVSDRDTSSYYPESSIPQHASRRDISSLYPRTGAQHVMARETSSFYPLSGAQRVSERDTSSYYPESIPQHASSRDISSLYPRTHGQHVIGRDASSIHPKTSAQHMINRDTSSYYPEETHERTAPYYDSQQHAPYNEYQPHAPPMPTGDLQNGYSLPYLTDSFTAGVSSSNPDVPLKASHPTQPYAPPLSSHAGAPYQTPLLTQAYPPHLQHRAYNMSVPPQDTRRALTPPHSNYPPTAPYAHTPNGYATYAASAPQLQQDPGYYQAYPPQPRHRAPPHAGHHPPPHLQPHGQFLPPPASPHNYYNYYQPPAGYGHGPTSPYVTAESSPKNGSDNGKVKPGKSTTSDLTVTNIPSANRNVKNKSGKAGLRAAINQGNFGI